MAYSYKGTKVTGTGQSCKGHKASKANQTYLNTTTGHVYKSKQKGSKNDKIWKYDHTDIVRAPGLAVTSLSCPERQSGNRKMKSTWGIPSDMTNAKMGNRATYLYAVWRLSNGAQVSVAPGVGDTESTVDLDWYGNYRRTSFYPFTGTRLTYVSVSVRAMNGIGGGPVASQTRYFGAPRQPSIGDWAFDPETGILSNTITTDAGADAYERYDTRYKVTVTNTRTGQTWNHVDASSTSTSIPISFDASDYQQLNYDQYIRVSIDTWARGYAGDSAHTYSTFYVSYPAQTVINDVDVTSMDSAGKCTVFVNTNNNTEHPVDRVKLEYLANVTYNSETSIPGDANWTVSNIVDNGNCTALAMHVGELLPDKGKHTWLRVKSYHAAENVLYRYSKYWRVRQIEIPAPTAEDDVIDIISTVPGEDGKSIVVTLGWNADGEDDSTGTELTWATEEDTWKSTKDPEDYEFEWSDGPLTVGSTTYQDSAVITIKGLTEGELYYIRARRYLEGESTTYSPYSNTETCITSETPDTVGASCAKFVPTGSSLAVTWTFSGKGMQKEWQIVDSNGAIIANGEGSYGATQISADRLADFAVNDMVTFTVQASTGSGFVSSESHTVAIVDAPALEVSAPATLTTQPLTFTAESSRLCDLVVIVTSQGAAGQTPTGIKRQTAGDTVHSGVYIPVWNDGAASVSIPTGLDFWQGGTYTLSVTAIDRDTGLKSETATADFRIDWTHRAVDPIEGVTLTPIDTVDDDTGFHRQAVEIALTPPEGSAATDVYDIYRLTDGKAYLIGSGFPLTHTTTDEYAPFGENLDLYYRIALRTADGDVAFGDLEYIAEGASLRFDWEGGFLELPYNLSISDKYKKDSEIRQHMSGSSDGYWNTNIERTASLSSDVIRLDQQDDVTKARELARYPGAVFVRTPDGSAYEADVQVSDMSTEGVITAIAVDATEISLTQEFCLPTPFTLDEEE